MIPRRQQLAKRQAQLSAHVIGEDPATGAPVVSNRRDPLCVRQPRGRFGLADPHHASQFGGRLMFDRVRQVLRGDTKLPRNIRQYRSLFTSELHAEPPVPSAHALSKQCTSASVHDDA